MCKTHPPAQLSGPYHFSISIWNRKITSSREKTPTCFLSAGQSKCEAAGLKLGRLHYCCRVAATEPAAVVFAGYEIILISPSLRSGEIRHYFFAADYLRLPKKGEPRTFRNVKEQYTKSRTKHRNGKFPSRKSLKKFYSVKHLPMHVTDNMEDIPISKLFPPPQLHCGILGPLNDTMKKLEQLFPVEMDEFKKDRHIKGSGPGGVYNAQCAVCTVGCPRIQNSPV